MKFPRPQEDTSRPNNRVALAGYISATDLDKRVSVG